jgi:hypothetical protein
MGNTHFRSDVRESGARTASFSTIAAGAVTANSFTGGTVSGTTVAGSSTVTGTGGVIAGSGKFFKLGTIYIITGAPSAFSNAGINAIATAAAGVSLATSVPRGSLFLNASSNVTASNVVWVKVKPATWGKVTTGSLL